ncbi:hypothetical protein Axi01nite_25690 [Actinoplanes xinjiangensis]|nr:hypothetical protein Axi01nite_25690 [Actinoplanes xinjiangensis]
MAPKVARQHRVQRGVAADQGGTGAAANQAHPGPQVRRDDQAVTVAAVQFAHPLLADRLAAPQALLDGLDVGRGHVAQQSFGLGPGGFGGVPGDHVQADAEPHRRVQRADPGQLPGHLGGRLAPGQVDVGVLGGDRAGGFRRATEVDRRPL